MFTTLPAVFHRFVIIWQRRDFIRIFKAFAGFWHLKISGLFNALSNDQLELHVEVMIIVITQSANAQCLHSVHQCEYSFT